MAGNRRRKGIPMDGMLLLDKPCGVSSNHALQSAKRLLNAQKAGHTGSLDPIATGLLPLCFGRATKVSGMFLESNKTYVVDIQLGVSTNTGDREGSIIAEANEIPLFEKIEKSLEQFIGEISQIPPMYSALKRNGQPLYKLARQGIEVERTPRQVTIFKLAVLNFSDDILRLEVVCSKGFYIRSLAMDIGESLGVGAHVKELRRTAVAGFTVAKSVTLEQLESLESPETRQNLLTPVDRALYHLPKTDLPENCVRFFCHGQTVRTVAPFTPGLNRLYAANERFLGLGEITDDGRVVPKRLFAEP
jgi:tRNA pseudouridine55 synthase